MKNKSCLRWIAIAIVFLMGCATAKQHPESTQADGARATPLGGATITLPTE